MTIVPLKSTSSLRSQRCLAFPRWPARQPLQRKPRACPRRRAGAGDIREPGIQGDVPGGANRELQLRRQLVGQLPGSATSRVRHLRVRAQPRRQGLRRRCKRSGEAVEKGSVRVQAARKPCGLVVTPERPLLVSGIRSTTFAIACTGCWARSNGHAQPSRLSLARAAAICGSIIRRHRVMLRSALWEADIANLRDPAWKVTDHRCEWRSSNRPVDGDPSEGAEGRRSLCVDATKPSPMGANTRDRRQPIQESFLWRRFRHSPDSMVTIRGCIGRFRPAGKRGLWQPRPKCGVIDLTQNPVRSFGEVNGPVHGLDWFRSGGRDYVLHSRGRTEGNHGTA